MPFPFAGLQEKALAGRGVAIVGGAQDTPFDGIAEFAQVMHEQAEVLALALRDGTPPVTGAGMLRCACSGLAVAIVVNRPPVQKFTDILDEDVVNVQNLRPTAHVPGIGARLLVETFAPAGIAVILAFGGRHQKTHPAARHDFQRPGLLHCHAQVTRFGMVLAVGVYSDVPMVDGNKFHRHAEFVTGFQQASACATSATKQIY